MAESNMHADKQRHATSKVSGVDTADGGERAGNADAVSRMMPEPPVSRVAGRRLVADRKRMMSEADGPVLSGSAFPHALSEPGLIDMAWNHWDALRAERPMPSRAELDPVDIPHLLPFTILLEVLRNPLDFRYRLLGTALDQIASQNYKGRRLSEIQHIEKGGKLWSDHERVFQTAAPLRSGVDYIGPDHMVEAVRHGLFPLSADGVDVSMIWVVAEIDRVGPTVGQTWPSVWLR